MAITPHKLAIIGVGRVGDAILNDAMMSNLFGSIVLLDVNEAMARGQALDQHHATALPMVANVDVSVGTYDDLADADVIMFTAGPSVKPSSEGRAADARRELTAINASIIRQTIPEIMRRTTEAAVIICSNPVDVLVHIAATEFGYPEGLLFGTGTILDSARMCRLIADHVGVDPDYVRGYMLGEHGPSGFPMCSGVNVGGVGFDGLPELFGVEPLNRDDLADRINASGFEVFNLKGWTSAGIGQSAITIARSILLDEKAVYPVCTTLRGQYGHDGDVSLGVPCVVGKRGIERILEVPLDEWEQQRMAATIETIKATIAEARA